MTKVNKKDVIVNDSKEVVVTLLLRSDWDDVNDKLLSFVKPNGNINTSQQIRYLLSLNWSRSHISKKLNVIYQRVRNVEIQPIKKANLLVDFNILDLKVDE